MESFSDAVSGTFAVGENAQSAVSALPNNASKVVDANTLNYESEIVLKYQQFTSKYALTFHRPQP